MSFKWHKIDAKRLLQGAPIILDQFWDPKKVTQKVIKNVHYSSQNEKKLKSCCNFVSFAPIELRLRLRKVDFFHLGTFFHRHFIFKSWLGPDPCPEVAWCPGDPSVFETLDVWKVIKKSADIHFFAKKNVPRYRIFRKVIQKLTLWKCGAKKMQHLFAIFR